MQQDRHKDVLTTTNFETFFLYTYRKKTCKTKNRTLAQNKDTSLINTLIERQTIQNLMSPWPKKCTFCMKNLFHSMKFKDIAIDNNLTDRIAFHRY